jgi:hypothetical protein
MKLSVFIQLKYGNFSHTQLCIVRVWLLNKCIKQKETETTIIPGLLILKINVLIYVD